MEKKLRVSFVIRSPDQFHYFSSIVSALCGRGHQVAVLFDERYSQKGTLGPINDFKNKFAGFTYGFTKSRTDRWRRLLFVVRELWTYSRFLRIPNQADIWRQAHLAY